LRDSARARRRVERSPDVAAEDIAAAGAVEQGVALAIRG
jgi:hypothetical protein